MDWREKLKERVGADGFADEGNIVDISDMEGWEFLEPEQLEKVSCKQSDDHYIV